MRYVSTRGDTRKITSAAAIIGGLAPDKGLYVPERIPSLPCSLKELSEDPYGIVAEKIIGTFLTDFSKEVLKECALSAYDHKFDTPLIAPVTKTEKAYFLELWHGATAAFKDMALSILPWLLKQSALIEKEDKKFAVLTATSGDTGKAALAGFADVAGTEAIVFYPKDGVSIVQEKQMTTQGGNNVHVFGIRGNFDDAQKGVKNVFRDETLAKDLSARGIRLASANSINIGRLVPQVVYYVNAYAKMLKNGDLEEGEIINICVPTGNFGNILSAWYAKQMGLPVGRLICASNENRILTDFINTGRYDRRREFILTTSPSMDILVSSNLERLIWHLSGCDSERVNAFMNDFENLGIYDAGIKMKEELSEFYGGSAEMPVSHAALAKLWREERYLLDTHTAVAYAVYLDYREKTGDNTKTLIASTASPYKFAGSVAGAIGVASGENEFRTIENIRAETGQPVPYCLGSLEAAPVLHDDVISKDEIKSAVTDALMNA